MIAQSREAMLTGGARGIGAGIARAMAGQGARVVLLDRDGPEAEKTGTLGSKTNDCGQRPMRGCNLLAPRP